MATCPFQMRLLTVSVQGMGLWRRKYKLLISIHKIWYVATGSRGTSKWIAELRLKILILIKKKN